MPERQSLVVVSNRLPVRRVDDAWEISPGGLVAALEPVLAQRGGAWVGWSGDPDEELPPTRVGGIDIVPVGLSSDDVTAYYDGMSNATLWPLYHHAVRPQVLDEDEWWHAYARVNERMVEAVVETAAPGGTVWVHDYHLQLVPDLLRRRRPDLRIGFFLHIPFPPSELFRRLPWRDEVVTGLLGADLIGFQTAADAENFRAAVGRSASGDQLGPHFEVDGRTVRVAAFPISIDIDRCRELATDPQVRRAAADLRRRLGSPEIVFVGVDRLDYTKGIVERLEAFERLLVRRPDLAGRAKFIQLAVPSRERVEEYEQLREDVERLVGRINGSHGGLGRSVVHYHHASIPFERVVALYVAADVMVVTPLADGMNRAGEDAALVVSEFAGAAEELGAGAIVVNAFDVEAIADGFEQAVALDTEDRCGRSRAMSDAIGDRNVFVWAQRFLETLTMHSGPLVEPRPTASTGRPAGD